MTHKPTDETRDLVAKLVVAGCSQEKIAFYLDIKDDTLRKHYARELQVPLIDATEVLANSLYQSALNGDKEDRRFWLTHRGGWYKAVAPPVDQGAGNMETILEKIIDKIPRHG